jgi:hypothetical protein
MPSIDGQISFSTTAEDTGVIRTVEVRRSPRRRRTIGARLDGSTLVVLVPDNISRAEESMWVEKMRQRFEDSERRNQLNSSGELERRAQDLNDQYFGGRLSWNSISYVTNQRQRYGSCTIDDKTIRLSDVLATMPGWVRDYVIIHELAHLEVPDHSKAFWRLVENYPLAERARGFLIAKGLEES